MKALKTLFFLTVIVFTIASCNTIRVTTDYEPQTDFTQYKTFAFYKKGIDKAPISDFDKRRIMRAISQELEAKGMKKSKNPDVLVSLFTKAKKRVDVYQNTWHPFYYSPFHQNRITKHTEGTLFIDILERETKKMIWQGIGKGFLSKSKIPEKRVENIKEFVKNILAEYPPKEEEKK